MVSPVEGEIVEVNPEVLKDPSILRKDPFGQGWLMTVRVPDEESVQHNFLPVHLVKAWSGIEPNGSSPNCRNWQVPSWPTAGG